MLGNGLLNLKETLTNRYCRSVDHSMSTADAQYLLYCE